MRAQATPGTVRADDAAAGWRGKRKRVHIAAAEAINRCSPLLSLHTHTQTHSQWIYTVCTSVYVSPYSASYLDTHTNNFGLCIPLPIGGEKIEEKGTCQNYLLFSHLSLYPGGIDSRHPIVL